MFWQNIPHILSRGDKKLLARGILASMPQDFPKLETRKLAPSEQICARFAGVLGPAMGSQTWFFFPPNDNGFSGSIIPYGRVVHPMSSLEEHAIRVLILGVADSVDSIVIGIERMGGAEPTAVESKWVHALIAILQDMGIDLEGVVVSHSLGASCVVMTGI